VGRSASKLRLLPPRPSTSTLAVMNANHAPVECENCGLALEHNPEDPTARPPCPRCGGTKRSYYGSNPQQFTLSNYTLDTFIAHRLSELTNCGAPELAAETKWLNTFILNSIIHFSIPPKTRAYLFNFLRRAEAASAAYREARHQLLEHIATPSNVVSPYFLSLAQFEVCVSQCYQGYELLARAGGTKLYEPGDGSPEERLQTVYVDSKHMDRMIDGMRLPESATSGIWITNSGLESSRGAITFQELHDVLSKMHELAEKLCALQPAAQKVSSQ